ncbi:hypothetical protein [Bacillus sp. JCM 19041]|uniref:hypothetical protein n=1 Tax=Bacillus sp. JCM 19041 TaxID=1460637 RepID=UPI0006D0779B
MEKVGENMFIIELLISFVLILSLMLIVNKLLDKALKRETSKLKWFSVAFVTSVAISGSFFLLTDSFWTTFGGFF